MTKRPPEMVEIRYNDMATKDADLVEDAIRSLRVKLFRERAARFEIDGYGNHHIRVTRVRDGKVCVVSSWKAQQKFLEIADAIERGER
jgi:hypothetical protein